MKLFIFVCADGCRRKSDIQITVLHSKSKKKVENKTFVKNWFDQSSGLIEILKS